MTFFERRFVNDPDFTGIDFRTMEHSA